MSLARWVVMLALLVLVTTASVKANSIYYDITDFHHDSIAKAALSPDDGTAFGVTDGAQGIFNGESFPALQLPSGLGSSMAALSNAPSFDDFSVIYDTRL